MGIPLQSDLSNDIFKEESGIKMVIPHVARDDTLLVIVWGRNGDPEQVLVKKFQIRIAASSPITPKMTGHPEARFSGVRDLPLRQLFLTAPQ